MARATIADIARIAQLSTATVDRVLNGRAGVSAANRLRVMRAARDLQYLPVEGGTVLPTQPARLEFFLPRGQQAFLRDVAHRIEEFAASLPLVASCQVHDLPDLTPQAFAAALERVDLRTQGVGVVAVDHPLSRLALRDLVEAGVKVVTFGSDILGTPRAAYVGLDDRVAGRTAALIMGRFARGRAGKVGLVVGQRAFHGQQERELGFVTLIEQEFPALQLLPAVDLMADNDRGEALMRELLAAHSDLVGVYSMRGGRTGMARALAEVDRSRRPFVIMHDLSDTTRRSLAADLIDLVIDQNARLVAEQVVIRLLGAIASTGVFLPEHFIEPRLIFRENIPD
ncbi:MAG: LacI family DNA-binding transcriptional regulator [Rubellimicrobium sp.]|nr:LacI family DNA-binding transcriptional regulator [Rubellimicrobium sp.]